METSVAGTDQINNFLRRIHLGAEVYYVGQLCDAWHMSTPGGDATTFHLVCNGEAWIHMPGQLQPVKMTAGDIAFFPNDAAHVFSGAPYVPDETFDYGNPAPLNKHAPGTGLLCGHLRLPVHIRRLLLASFPDLVVIHPDRSPIGRQIRILIELMTEEATLNDLGVTAILDRLSDTLFLYILRHTLHQSPGLSPLLAALSEEHLRLAISAFIDNPAENWTVERMAKLACQSRSTFSERFSSLVKLSPMEFVATWRMQLATGWLAEGNANMLDVAIKCGYESEAAFRKAFKRIIGFPPGKLRNPASTAEHPDDRT
jgi:AraC-like DNA-binding protein